MLSNYVFGAHAVLLCYDITNFDSFQNLEDWYRVVRRTFEKAPKMPYCALLANKCDLSHMRTVRNEVHNRFADENELVAPDAKVHRDAQIRPQTSADHLCRPFVSGRTRGRSQCQEASSTAAHSTSAAAVASQQRSRSSLTRSSGLGCGPPISTRRRAPRCARCSRGGCPRRLSASRQRRS